MFRWLLSPKTLTAVAAILTAVAAIWGLVVPAKDKPPPVQPAAQQQAPVTINIDAKQTNSQTVSQSPAIVPAPAVAVEKQVLPTPQERLPVRRQLARGIPVEVLKGFWLTLAGYEGVESDMRAYMSSPSWGNQAVELKVKGAPFHFTHDTKTYLLHVESIENERLFVTIRQ